MTGNIGGNHSCSYSNALMLENGINLIICRARSPDLNPIGNVLDKIDSILSGICESFKTRTE